MAVASPRGSVKSVTPFLASGIVRVPHDGRDVPRLYAIVEGGAAFLVAAGVLSGSGEAGELETVPESARSAIKEAHPDLSVSFPDAYEEPGAPRSPGQDAALVWVDPAKINLVYGGPRVYPKKDLLNHGGGELDGDWDRPWKVPFEELDVHQALRHRFIEGGAWETTGYYERIVGEIKAGKKKWGCKTEAEFRQRCAGLDELFMRMTADGYRTQGELKTDRPADEVRVAVRRDGRLLFVDGRHRLSIARLLGLERIPVRIVARHSRWLAIKEEIEQYAEAHRGRIYQQIDHPDLVEIPAGHRTARIELIKGALTDYEAGGKRLLDIGGHWGYMCQQLQPLGFQCTVVEANARSVTMARRLAVALETPYDVWRGSIFDFPEPEQFEVVLGLSIFHHFLKTEEAYLQLVALLRRLSAELIFFEAHKHDPPGQMEGAYRNYPQEEFAEFVAMHAGMNRIERLGTAENRRVVFMLAR
jgi:hypothetical protein